MTRVVQGLHAVMALLFLFAVAVQVNDPDPIRWMAIYGAAALCCLDGILGKFPRAMAPAVGGIALIWALTLLPSIVGTLTPGRWMTEFHMSGDETEEIARETGGLLLVFGWMCVLTARSWRTAARRSG